MFYLYVCWTFTFLSSSGNNQVCNVHFKCTTMLLWLLILYLKAQSCQYSRPIFKPDIQGRLKKVTFLFKADLKIFLLSKVSVSVSVPVHFYGISISIGLDSGPQKVSVSVSVSIEGHKKYQYQYRLEISGPVCLC